jgi:O-antigen/teichoic acid export membrane protein
MKWRLPPWLGGTERDTSLLLGLNLFCRLTGLALLAVISRRLPQHDIGAFFFAVAFAESLAMLASFNLGPLMMRRVAADPERAGEHLAAVLGFRLASAPLYLLVTPVAGALGAGLPWTLIVPVTVFVLMENVYHKLAMFFMARGKLVYDIAIGGTVQTAFLAVVVVWMWLAPSLNALLGANLFRGAALMCVGLLVAHARVCPLRATWSGALVRDSLPFAVISFLRLLRTHLETLLLGFLATAGSVAVFSLAFRVVVAAQFVPMSFAAALFPRLAARGFDAENRAMFRRATLTLGGVAVAAMAVTLAAAEPLCALMFGSLSGEVAPLLRLLSLQFPLGFGIGLAGSALVALGHERRVLAALVLGICASILVSLLLIPRWGPFGAVVGHLASASVELAVLLARLRLALRHPVQQAGGAK